MTADPLKDLLLDVEEVDRARLARGLKDILGVDSETGKVVAKPGFNRLNAMQKVLAFLLGVKVAFLLGKVENESIAVKDIVNETGLPRGTVAPKLRELLSRRLISQMNTADYYVASHQLLEAIRQINKEDRSNE